MRTLTLLSAFAALGFAQDLIPPSAPTSLTATAASCGQVNLSWSASVDNAGGSGLKAYTINRSDGNNISIGAARTTFSDTNYVKSSAALTYTVAAMDNAGNKSPASNTAFVNTPACSVAAGETVIDGAYMEPLGKSMATYGTRTALIYVKLNFSTMKWDTWINFSDSGTGQTSRFLLHTSPGYYQAESDYVLTSATDLWTLSGNTAGGNLMVSQYKLNGSPPASATLVSTKLLGSSISHSGSMIRLQSGGLIASWYEDGMTSGAQDLTTGYAYRSPAGVWSVKFPVTVPNSGGGTITLSQMILAQHPADSSIWAFVKRDSFYQISALHFTEINNDVLLDWINPSYITDLADGDNGPQGEFPFLAATADFSRNAILLAYQTNSSQIVYVDPLFYAGMNNIFLKQAFATIAQVRADGTKTFIPFNNSMERGTQFGMSSLSDGTIWLAYQPINSQTLTWNQVYASKYQSGVWSTPSLTGLNYTTYNTSSGARDPGLMIYRTDQAQVAFMTPDQKIHSLALSDSAPPASDTTAPTSSISNPLNGASVSGIVSVTATASDNVGVARVDFLVDGVVKGTKSAGPYSFSWDTTTTGNGNHTLQSVAYDAAGNAGASAPVTDTVSNTLPDATAPVVVITSPANGSTVARNTTMTIAVTATDNVSVARVDFYVNGTLIGTDTGVPYTYSWKVPGKNNASYTLKVVASDSAGNSASSTVTVTAK